MPNRKPEKRYSAALEDSSRRLALKITKRYARLDVRDLDARWPSYLEAMGSAGVQAEYEVSAREALLYLLDVLMGAGHAIRTEPTPRPFDHESIRSLLRLCGPIHVKRMVRSGYPEQAAMMAGLRRTVLWMTGHMYVEANQTMIDAGTSLNTPGETVLQGYERVPEPTACAFCKMLAGASRKHAVYEVTQAWQEPHPHCKCEIKPVPVFKTIKALTAREIAVNQAMYESIKASRDRALAAAKAAA